MVRKQLVTGRGLRQTYHLYALIDCHYKAYSCSFNCDISRHKSDENYIEYEKIFFVWVKAVDHLDFILKFLGPNLHLNNHKI